MKKQSYTVLHAWNSSTLCLHMDKTNLHFLKKRIRTTKERFPAWQNRELLPRTKLKDDFLFDTSLHFLSLVPTLPMKVSLMPGICCQLSLSVLPAEEVLLLC